MSSNENPAQTNISHDRDDAPDSAPAHDAAPAPEDVARPARRRRADRMPSPRSGTANIGVVGLAVMGSNLARNLASREGNTVAIYNRSHAKTETLLAEHPEAEFVPASELRGVRGVAAEAADRDHHGQGRQGHGCRHRRARWTSSSRATSSSTAATPCSPTRSAARRRCARPASTSSAPGISGGEEGALLGPSIMPGGSDESWVTLGPILQVHRRGRRGRAVRHARRPRRRRPLREDGAQRHRVRRHAAHRRGLRPDPPRHRQDAPPRSPTCSPSGTRASWSRT